MQKSNSSEFEIFSKELFIPISDEEALNDPTSDQYSVWKIFSSNLPKLLGKAFAFKNTYEIQERYAIFVVNMGLSRNQLEQTTQSDTS